MLRTGLRLLVVLLLGSISALWAQDTLSLGSMKYREVGPSRGGRVTTVAGVASQPQVFYMGSTGGGIWKTEDYGHSWRNVSDGYLGSPSLGAITVWQANPELVYAGTGSDGLRSNVIAGDGVYRSTNGGKTWEHMGLEKTGHIGAVEIHPTDSSVVFVAAIGNAFVDNPERGVYRSRDGGQTWEQVLFISERTGFSDLVFHPTQPEVIYAGAWRAQRTPWTIISGDEEENGIYRSQDGGDSWTKLTDGLPTFCGKIDLAVSPAEPDKVVALIEAPAPEGGLYVSADAGTTWRQITDNEDLLVRPFYFLNVDLDPTNAEVVYVNTLRFHKSTDGGQEWSTLGTPHGDNHAMWINPNNPKIFIQGNDGGANVTLDGGRSWSHQFNQPTAELYQVEVDNQHPYRLYAGQQDNYTAIAVPSLPPRSMQAGHVAYIEDVGGCETGPAVPHPTNPDIVYANCKGRFSVYNRATGQEQSYNVGGQFMYGHNPRDLQYRFQRVSPIHVSPHNPEVVYHTSQYVHRTRDGGKTWETISPDLTAFEEDKQVISGGPITRDITGEEFYSTLYAIRESPVQAGVIWVGSNDGPIHVTKDGGQTWTNVTPPDLPGGGRVDAVEPSPHVAGKAYVAVLRYQLGDWKPYVYKTEDFGATWSLLTPGNNGIPEGYPTRVVREDPLQAGHLYVGTEYGLFASFDEGNSWQSIQGNLPITPISDLKLHRRDLVISTMGRGFWIFDEYPSLAPSMGKGPIVHRTAEQQIRWNYSSGTNGEITQYPSYPRPGIYIDYEIKETLAMPLRLEIFREEERRLVLLRSWESTDPGEETDENAEPEMATGFVAVVPSQGLKDEVGRHRFRWDLRHAGTWDEEPRMRYAGGGPTVAPGTYVVRLTSGDFVESRFVEVLPDPRLAQSGVTQEDLERQERLLLQMRDFYSGVLQYVYALEQEQADLQEKSRLNRKQQARLAVIEGKLALLVNDDGPYPQQMFVSQVAYLYRSLMGADQAPGQDVFDRFLELQSQWHELKD